MVKILVSSAFILALTGCAQEPLRPPEPIIKVQTVTKLVPVARTPPPALVACTKGVPLPAFDDAPVGSGFALALRQPEASKLKAMIQTLKVCVSAWATWAAEPEK